MTNKDIAVTSHSNKADLHMLKDRVSDLITSSHKLQATHIKLHTLSLRHLKSDKKHVYQSQPESIAHRREREREKAQLIDALETIVGRNSNGI